MFKGLIFLFLVFFFIRGCDSENKLYVSGTLKNITDNSISITIGSDPRTLLKPIENAMVCDVSEDGSFSFEVEVQYPLSLTLLSENYQFVAYVHSIHGGDIHITADCNNLRETIEYSGSNGELNTSYLELSRSWDQAIRSLNKEELSYDEFLSKIDSINIISTSSFKEILNKNTLTEKEIQWLSSKMKYRKYSNLRGRANRLKADPGASDFYFFESLDLTDEEACELDQSYNNLVWRYVLHQVNLSGIFYKQSADNERYYYTTYQAILENLKGRIKDVQLNIFITDLLSRNEACADEYYDRFLEDCKSKDLKMAATAIYNEYINLSGTGFKDNIIFISTHNQNPKDVLSSFEGKVLYLDFWASWCSPCLNSIPNTLELADHYRNKDVEIIFVGYQDHRSSLEGAIKKYKIDGKHIILTQNETDVWREEFQLVGIPSYVLLDRKQRVVKLNAPFPENPLLIDMIDSLLIE